ncbi:MAG: metallophosphoesterase [Bacteroidales bacterium]|nr:metallophosphoesterase [Bacteroidales bacterium]
MPFFVLFFVALFFGAIIYIYMRMRCAMPPHNTVWGVAARILYIVLCACFFVGFALQRNHMVLSQPFTLTGNWMLAAALYLFLIFFVIDLARIVNSFTFKAEWLTFRYRPGDTKAEFFATVVGIVCALILIIGYFNAHNPTRREITLKTEKNIERGFKFILISDVHLGMVNSDKFFNTLANRINAEDADFVVIAGDFFDGDPQPVLYSHADSILRTIKTRYGIYAVNGNHEWIGNANIADEFLVNNGVTVLRDSSARLPLGVTIVGREDRSARIDFKLGGRKQLADIVENINRDDYSIVIDHQPYHLEEAEQNNIDLQLSGHTHHGQLWPLNFLTSHIYECSFGQHRRSNTQYYVSAGYGTWGPPIRTTCRPEMVVINVEK